MNDNSTQQGVAGHGAFFQDTNLSADTGFGDSMSHGFAPE